MRGSGPFDSEIMTTPYVLQPARSLAAITMLVGAACSEAPPVRQFAANGATDAADWSHLFVERRIDLQFPDSGAPPRRIAKLVATANGEIIVPDGRGRRILRFDAEGRLLQEIKDAPDRSFEIVGLGAIALDPRDNLLFYERDSSMVTVLDRSSFRPIRRFQIRGPVSDFVALEDGSVVSYYPDDERGVFKRFDRNGTLTSVTHPIPDEALRVFHSRVQNGGIAQDSAGDLFGIEPTRFQLVQLSPGLAVRRILRPDSADVWAPSAKRFPRGLRPVDYRQGHREWWDSFMHIGRPFGLTRGVVLVTVFSSRGLSRRHDFANLYHTDGRILARGLRVPHDGHVVSAGRGKVYVVRDARADTNDVIRPLELYEYRLRDTAALAALMNP
jgi:hypothetical protein